jgi:hypothetical protein
MSGSYIPVSWPTGTVTTASPNYSNINIGPGNVMLASDLSGAQSNAHTTILCSELEELRSDSKLLYALIDAGVEEWPGYQEALLKYLEEE